MDHSFSFFDPNTKKKTGILSRKTSVSNSPSIRKSPSKDLKATPARIVEIAASQDNCAVLTQNGNIFYWGTAFHSELNPIKAPLLFDSLSNKQKKFVSVAVGHRHLLVLSDDGCVFSAGGNHHKQLGYSLLSKSGKKEHELFSEQFEQVNFPLPPSSKKDPLFISKISCGMYHCAALTSTTHFSFHFDSFLIL